MKNPRNRLSVMQIAKESFPGKLNYVLESYQDATKNPYSYFIFDLHQKTNDDMRLVTNIIPSKDDMQTFYLPIN